MAAGEGKQSKLFSALGEVLRRKSMRPVVRVFTALHVALYRLTGGKAQVPIYPYFAEYQERTQREIPVVVLRPDTGACVA